MKNSLLRRRDFLGALTLETGLAPLVGQTKPLGVFSSTDTCLKNQLLLGRALEKICHDDLGTQIKVVGVGGGGGRVVKRMIDCGVQGVDFIYVDSDIDDLIQCGLAATVPIGYIDRGAARKPWRGRDHAKIAESAIQEAIAGAHMLFITAGMGGDTGTGAASMIARVAKEMGILNVVGVITKPFDFEGPKRMADADAGLAKLEQNVDSLIVVPNEKLLEMFGHMTQGEFFAHADDTLKSAIGGIAEIINVPGHVAVDFEDVRTVMGLPGKATMGTARASGPDRARIAAEQAIACPLLGGIDLSSAKGVLVLISASKGSLKLSESKLAMITIRAFASEDAHIIYGTVYDDKLGDAIRVTVVVAGNY